MQILLILATETGMNGCTQERGNICAVFAAKPFRILATRRGMKKYIQERKIFHAAFATRLS